MHQPIRGIESHQEHAARLISRDTRPLGTRIAEFLCRQETIIALCIVFTLIFFWAPAYIDIVAIILSIIFTINISTQYKQHLPFRIPKSAKTIDYGDLKPGTFQPRKAEGIAFFGNNLANKEELWFSNTDLRTHILFLGSTGSGKTESLISLAFNALIHGSGFIYVDGKGDNSLFAKIFSMVRQMGRDDDLLVINFMTGARDIVGPQQHRISNTINPFANGSSSMLSQLVISLMDSSSSDPNGDMWKGRAINFVESLMKVLTIMRDNGHILLDANTIRDYFRLELLEKIVIDRQFPINDEHSVNLNMYPDSIVEPLKNYLLNLPGFTPSKKGKQASEVLEQHGYITMQLTRVFGSLADTYGHILRTNLAEVDLRDVVLNRRIMVVLLPALEKSPEELANLGKIIIASLKAMMAAGLGDQLEGDYQEVIERKPTNSLSPYLCILDEYGYYAVKGFSVVAAQARSLGFSAVFAGQDLPAFQKASKEEAASIGANCNIKICMKLEDPLETWDYFNKTAGETYVTNVSGFQIQPNSMMLNYLDNRNASIDRRQRIELLDLKDQREGDAHIFFKSNIIRAKMFYANPKPVKTLSLNSFIKVSPLSSREIENIYNRLQKFEIITANLQVNNVEITPNDDILSIVNTFKNNHGSSIQENSMLALAEILTSENTLSNDLSDEDTTLPRLNLAKNDISIFSPIPISPQVIKIVDKNQLDFFQIPLLEQKDLFLRLTYLERLSGKIENQAKQEIKELLNDMHTQTTFCTLKIPQDIGFKQYKQDLQYLLNEFDCNIDSFAPTDQYVADIESIIKKLSNSPSPQLPSLEQDNDEEQLDFLSSLIDQEEQED